MSQEARIVSLQARHASLENQIAAEDGRPRPDAELLNRLKIDKLHIKQEIERLRSARKAA
ncbi:MAG: YdcH family protein [Alphaproteobacteria bacterium]|nr:YdcH family protein [Alphaproteobacteria bacterium]